MIDTTVSAVLRTIAEEVGTPRALSVFLMDKYDAWDEYIKLDCSPLNYDNASDYRQDALLTNMLKKCVDLPTSVNRKAVAIGAFWDAERRNYRSNERLGGLLEKDYPPAIRNVFLTARKIIARIIGNGPPRDLDGYFGPGSTFYDVGQLTTIPDKIRSQPALTADAWVYVSTWGKTLWARSGTARDDLLLVRGNRFLTVPKDCRKDRGIAVEPSLNLYYQLGLGRVLRRALRSARITLERAQDVHRWFACEASISGRLCTEDLSNASDTICSELIRLLLPPNWFAALDACRSKFTFIEGRWVKLEKFSSMGNGFTFELETLVFLSLILATGTEVGEDWWPGRDVFVFGDDIIFPAAQASDVNAVLSFCGLVVNKEKSFVDGPFRESCGGDFFSGTDVRPFFVKEFPTEPHQLIVLANQVRRFFGPCKAWFKVLDSIPTQIRSCRGPEGLGDIVIHDSPGNWTTKWRDGIRYVKTYGPQRRELSWNHWPDSVRLASSVYGLGRTDRSVTSRSSRDVDSGVIPRDSISGYRTSWVAYS